MGRNSIDPFAMHGLTYPLESRRIHTIIIHSGQGTARLPPRGCSVRSLAWLSIRGARGVATTPNPAPKAVESDLQLYCMEAQQAVVTNWVDDP